MNYMPKDGQRPCSLLALSTTFEGRNSSSRSRPTSALGEHGWLANGGNEEPSGESKGHFQRIDLRSRVDSQSRPQAASARPWLLLSFKLLPVAQHRPRRVRSEATVLWAMNIASSRAGSLAPGAPHWPCSKERCQAIGSVADRSDLISLCLGVSIRH